MSDADSNNSTNNNNDTSSDEAVSQFLAITGSSDASQAQSYLEMSANDLQSAITLFFEHQQGSGGSSSNSISGGGFGSMTSTGMNTDATTTSSAAANSFGGAAGGDDNVRAPDQTRTMRLMDFEGPTGALGVGGGNDMAGLMNHPVLGPHAAMMAAGMGMGMGMMGGDDHENQFAMSAFAEDSSGVGFGRHDTEMVMSGNVRDMINASARSRRSRAGAGGSSQQSDGSGSLNVHIDEDEGDDEVQVVGRTGGTGTNASSGAGATVQRLSDMFAAPLHLIHKGGGFQGARNVAKDTRRWLLVNLQSDSDFACHALNRDVWRDELVENLVREGFIFWQSTNTTTDGQTYVQRYNVTAYPHIGIIDPRTARLMYHKEGWTQEKPMTAENFAEIAVDFCSRNSFDKPPGIPKNKNTSASSNNGTASQKSTGMNEPPARVERMTEEEQLQAAIRASMTDVVTSANNDDDSSMDADKSEYVLDDDDDNDDEMMEESEEEEVKEVTFHDEIVGMDVGEEPSGTDGVARIMIRMPDGKRLVRKFNGDDSVKMIYAFVSQSSDDAKNGKEFELKAGFPPKNLLPIVDDTIKSSGLAGDSVTVRWKED